jgi:type I restriction enzyme S subunit
MSSVDEIPNGWVETTLGDVCKIKYGKDHKKLEDGDIPCYGSGGIMRYVDSILYDKPSVLIPRKGTLSNLFFINEPFWTVDTLFYTQIDESIIKSNYLYYKLKTYNLADLNVGSAVPSLTTSVLNQLPFSIP